MKSVQFHPEAEAEMIAAAQFYQERADGLGVRFLESVQAVIRHISNFPKSARIVRGRVVRAAVARTFPYSVVYSELGDEVVVLAVAHQRRRPGYWKTRVTRK